MGIGGKTDFDIVVAEGEVLNMTPRRRRRRRVTMFAFPLAADSLCDSSVLLYRYEKVRCRMV